MKGQYVTEGGRACVECGTEGGYVAAGDRRPRRRRGLCTRCYMRAYDYGRLEDYREHQVGFDYAAPPIPPVGPLEDLIPIPPSTPRWRGAWASAAWNKAVQYEVERGKQWLAARQLAA